MAEKRTVRVLRHVTHAVDVPIPERMLDKPWEDIQRWAEEVIQASETSGGGKNWDYLWTDYEALEEDTEGDDNGK